MAKVTIRQSNHKKDKKIQYSYNYFEIDISGKQTKDKSIFSASIIKAFGDDTSEWIGKTAKLTTADIMVSGKLMKTIMISPIGGKDVAYEA